MKKVFSFISMAAAVVLAASCNKEDSAWRKLTPEENLDRVAVIISETVDKASPMYASKAFGAYRYLTSNYGTYNVDELSQFLAAYGESHATTGKETVEDVAFDLTTMVIALGDLKGHFSVVDDAWVKKDASDFQIEMPYQNGSTLTFKLSSADTGDVLLTDEYTNTEESTIERTELDVPKRLNASLKVGKETVATAKVSVASRLSGSVVLTKSDKLCVNSVVTLQDFTVTISNLSIEGGSLKGAVKMKKGKELLFASKVNASLMLDEEKEEMVIMGMEKVKADFNINDQLAGDMNMNSKMISELEDEIDEAADEAAAKAIEAKARPYFTGSFYLDGHKSNKQGKFITIAELDPQYGDYDLNPAIEFGEGSILSFSDCMDYLFNDTNMLMHIQFWIAELRNQVLGPVVK